MGKKSEPAFPGLDTWVFYSGSACSINRILKAHVFFLPHHVFDIITRATGDRTSWGQGTRAHGHPPVCSPCSLRLPSRLSVTRVCVGWSFLLLLQPPLFLQWRCFSQSPAHLLNEVKTTTCVLYTDIYVTEEHTPTYTDAPQGSKVYRQTHPVIFTVLVWRLLLGTFYINFSILSITLDSLIFTDSIHYRFVVSHHHILRHLNHYTWPAEAPLGALLCPFSISPSLF